MSFGEGTMPKTVTEYLDHARVCADLADTMNGEDHDRLMEIAKAWLKLATARAKELTEKKPDQ
jgi:hypothetical protein